MTIRIIRTASLGLPVGAIRTLDSATESALIAAKEAVAHTETDNFAGNVTADAAGNLYAGGKQLPTSVSAPGGGSGTLPLVTSQKTVSLVTSLTASDASFVTFAAQACTELIIDNRFGVELEYQRNGAGNVVSIKPGQRRRIVGITDASQVGIRRADYADANAPTGASRQVTVRATAATCTETFSHMATLSLAITNGGGNTALPAQACSAIEIINNTGKALNYRTSAADQYVVLASGDSVIINGLTDASAVQVQPFGNVADLAARPLMVECFAAALREPLNTRQAVARVSPNARVALDEPYYPSQWPTGVEVAMGEIARGPRRTLTPAKSIALARFTTVANLVAGTAATASIDAADGELAQGASQVEFTQPSAATYTLAANEPALGVGVDVTAGFIRITISFPAGSPNYSTASALSSLRVQLFSAGSPNAAGSAYHEAGLSSFQNGFMNVSASKRNYSWAVPISSFSAVGGGATLTAITWARFQLVGAASGNGAKFRPVDITYTPNPLTKGIVCFTNDDFHAGTYLNALPILSRYGYPMTLYADSVIKLGQAGFLTAAQLQQLHQKYGWQVANQNYFQETAVAMNVEQTLQEHSKFNLAMQALGIGDIQDSSYGSASTVNFRDDNLLALKRSYRTGRMFNNGNNSSPPMPMSEMLPFGDPWRFKCMNMSSGFTAGTFYDRWKDHADQAIAAKGIAVYGSHSEFNTGGPAENLTAFQALVDYLRTQELAGNVEVLTISQAVSRGYPI